MEYTHIKIKIQAIKTKLRDVERLRVVLPRAARRPLKGRPFGALTQSIGVLGITNKLLRVYGGCLGT